MNPGLPQGFVRLGTTHHRLLVALHQLGPLRHRDLVEELGVESRQVSVAIAQLSRAGCIHRHPAARAYETGERTQAVWALEPYRGSKPLRAARVPGRERSARYRASRRLRVASVFHFRPGVAAA